MQQPFQHPKEAISISRNIRKKKQRMILIICCAAIAAVLIGLIFLLLLPKSSPQEPVTPAVQEESTEPTSLISAFLPKPKIPKGTSISGIPVGGMTEEQAISAVRSSVSDAAEKEDLILSVGEETLRLSPQQSKVHWAIEEAVEAALKGGKVSLELVMDKTAIMEALQDFFDSLGGVYVPSGYWLEGDAPDLEQMDGPCQTLVINTGSNGHLIDLQGIYEEIVNAYEKELFQVSVEIPEELREPAPLDLEQIYNQVAVLPQNPSIDHTTLEVIPGKDGYGFDIERAFSLLESAEKGTVLRIPMEYLQPEVSQEDAWFQETLGYCKTEHSDNENRNENLRLACAKLNGLILQPGETLSYNEALGKRTREAGYMPAPAYSGTELVDEVGGGICQVSSTLYLSSLFAELTIVERKNHGFPANYIPLGLDATVNWGTTDLKIRNDYELPVKILAEVSDGYVKVRIMGVDLRDYYVKMEYRVDDHPSYAAAYRCRYDRETDEEIFRELNHTSTYLEEVWCWPGYAENASDEPEIAETP